MEKVTENTDPNQKIDKRKTMPHLFKPGQSGNPKGKPPGAVSITGEIKAKLLKIYPEKQVIGADGKKIKKLKKTYLQKIIEAIFENAVVQKDTRTLNQIWAYIDGQPKATLDIGADKESLATLTEFFRGVGKKKK